MTLNDLVKRATEMANALSSGDVELYDAANVQIRDIQFTLTVDEDGTYINMEEIY